MSQNTVADVVANRSLSLFEKIGSNLALSNLLMGFLGRISVDCLKQGKPLEGIEFGTISETNGTFSFRVVYQPISIPSARLTMVQGDLQRYFSARSRNLALVLQKNPRLVTGFTNLVEAIDRWCAQKGKRFSDFEIMKAYVTQENVFVLRSGKQGLGRWS